MEDQNDRPVAVPQYMMTRDLIAISALSACALPSDGVFDPRRIAQRAYAVADEMLKLSKGSP